MAAVVSSSLPSLPMHLNAPFDVFYVLLLPVLCIAAGVFVASTPQWYELALTLNLWLLGYHHVIATYTRIAFDRRSITQHRYETLILPFFVVVAVTALVTIWGVWLVGTIYLYWQWYHYTRQSEGVAKSYFVKAGGNALPYEYVVFRIAFYIVAASPFLLVGTRSIHQFLGFEVWILAIPSSFSIWLHVVYMLAAIFMLGVALRWLYTGRTSVFHVAYLLGHAAIYGFAYGVSESLDLGWLALSMWHNTQYLLFVWLFNRKRYKDGYDPDHALISYLSQPGRAVMYFLATLLLTVCIYGIFDNVISAFAAGYTFQATVIVYQTLNFHHYIVDSRIWKLRKASVKETLFIRQS